MTDTPNEGNMTPGQNNGGANSAPGSAPSQDQRDAVTSQPADQPNQPQASPAQQAQTQPTVPYPPAPSGADYAHGAGAPQHPAYANQAQYGAQNQGPYGAQQQAGAQGQPYAAGQAFSAPAKPTLKKRSTGLIVASLAVGALIGGAAGGGISAGVFAASQGSQSSTVSTTGPANITVNNPKSATLVTAVAAKASPSVVTINVAGRQESGTGSGIVLSKDGYVLTNTHVVTLDGEASNVNVQVTDNNGKIYKAKVVGTDPIVDLAVIKLEGAKDMSPATFGDSSKLNVGDTAVAIGAPLGLSGTVTDGIVSALNRSISIASSAAPKTGDSDQGGNGENGPYDLWNFAFPGQGQESQQAQANSTISLPVIQTDASINPGNSGGPLLNDQGDVIGVNVAIASAGSGSSSPGDQSGSIGVGFAIPSDLAQRIGQELIKDHKGSHGLLGATVSDSSAESDSTTVGALIHSVTSGGAAAKAGLKAGDIVTNFNDRPIKGATDLTAQVRYLAGGSSADLSYVRNGKTYTVTVTLGTMKQD